MRSPQVGPAKVLLVDDDILIRNALARAMADAPFELRVVDDGRKALCRLETEGPFKVIISDFLMPGMNGCDLLHKVRLLFPDLVRILFTAHPDQGEIRACLKRGDAVTLIAKPWDDEHVRQVLLEAVNNFPDSG